MLDAIFTDLRARFGKLIGMAIAGIVIVLLVIFLGKMVWHKVFGTDTGSLKQTIAEQTHTIEKITDLNQSNAAGAALQRDVQEVAKNDLVQHVQTQAKVDKTFDQLALKLDKEYVPRPQPKKAVKPAVKTPIPSLAPEPVVSEDPEAEARETARQQRNAVLLQDTIWQAYELAAPSSV